MSHGTKFCDKFDYECVSTCTIQALNLVEGSIEKIYWIKDEITCTNISQMDKEDGYMQETEDFDKGPWQEEEENWKYEENLNKVRHLLL